MMHFPQGVKQCLDSSPKGRSRKAECDDLLGAISHDYPYNILTDDRSAAFRMSMSMSMSRRRRRRHAARFAAAIARERYSPSIARAKASALPRRNMRGIDRRSRCPTAYRLRADKAVQTTPEVFIPSVPAEDQRKREKDR
ncbi:MAG TPA: hypothetical protein VF446_16165 [Trinickia sp.]